MTKKTEGSWYYHQIELSFNYRMKKLQDKIVAVFKKILN